MFQWPSTTSSRSQTPPGIPSRSTPIRSGKAHKKGSEAEEAVQQPSPNPPNLYRWESMRRRRRAVLQVFFFTRRAQQNHERSTRFNIVEFATKTLSSTKKSSACCWQNGPLHSKAVQLTTPLILALKRETGKESRLTRNTVLVFARMQPVRTKTLTSAKEKRKTLRKSSRERQWHVSLDKKYLCR